MTQHPGGVGVVLGASSVLISDQGRFPAVSSPLIVGRKNKRWEVWFDSGRKGLSAEPRRSPTSVWGPGCELTAAALGGFTELSAGGTVLHSECALV